MRAKIIRWTESVAFIEATLIAYIILIVTREGKRYLGRRKYRRDDNIKIGNSEITFEVED
jgi:hypothetical protein